MLFGEYLVLRGANCTAFPTRYGQKLTVTSSESNSIRWEASARGVQWFWANLDEELNVLDTNNEKAANKLSAIFQLVKDNNPELNIFNHYSVEADFDLSWGFGSSSTFVSLIAQWAEMNPFKLQAESFGGSGYDVACATSNTPLQYTMNGVNPEIETISIHENVQSQILFGYLGQKQDSGNEVKRFSDRAVSHDELAEMNEIVQRSNDAETIEAFESCMKDSEDFLSPILEKEPIKDKYFNDYPYEIKSLGAWGGDFFMASFRDEESARNYFESKNIHTIFNYHELIK